MSLTIDCESCPVRGRHCDDCFVPVLAKAWLEEPRARRSRADEERPGPALLALDFEETEAVEAFARAGLISRVEAHGARAHSTVPGVAVG
ncbi:hypothetical protein [Ornithinimicrobium murale]|uniref:hypothetical protein n=1 Tax=Ornithinimicrobium murale TaxID=1050153 RepID=UPI000E0D1761|nr:hypothetical protein [Ornithinimicrobium murale]